MGATLLSIVDDTPAETGGGNGITHYNYKYGSRMIPVLRKKMGEAVVVFGGMRYAPLEGIYMTLASVISGERIEHGMTSVVNDTCLSLVCKLPNKKTTMKNMIYLEGTKNVKLDYELNNGRLLTLDDMEKQSVGETYKDSTLKC